MSATAKKIIMAVIIAVIALTALGLGAWGVSMYFVPFGDDSAEGYTIAFDSDTILMRSDAVTAPASGYVRRSFSAHVLDSEGYEVEDADITYSMSKQTEGVVLDENGMMSVYSTLQKGATFDVTASYTTPGGVQISVSKKTSVEKDDSLATCRAILLKRKVGNSTSRTILKVWTKRHGRRIICATGWTTIRARSATTALT